ncbi:LCP family protein [Nocardioides sp. zg-DK7169]|uniref:LCP family protein n=1 Tax=Nocardioides sp. zg-DK7169 TaxID=2736600 RepID=UPI00155819E5|nr:LCP family protein [Nocardioides sp. zg-DK7169]NPC95891.1 LCP family protein [Nocardioides sp. zg-DK7169]
MADRPRNDGSGEGTPEYGWLYGAQRGNDPSADPDATRPVPRQPRPDETRVLPVQPRPDAGGGQTGSRSGSRARTSERPPAPAPAPAPPARSGSRGRRLRFRPRYLLLLVLAWVVYLVAVPIYAWTEVESVPWEPDGERPPQQPGTTYLMVGSDSRDDLSEEERRQLGTGGGAGQRTDTIMLLHTGDGPNVLISIPRDSIVEVPGHGTTKINAAFAYDGAPGLVRTIENATGIRIDEYVEIGMGGLAGVVDAVGGIEICPTFPMKDPQAKLDIDKGCQQADGQTALGFARSRKTDPQYGDITRVRHQREVVAAVGDKVLSPWTFLNPVRYWRLAHSVPGFFVFGDGTGPIDAARWALAMTRVEGSAGMTCTVPIRDLAVNWDEERSQRMFEAIIEDRTDDIGKDLCTPTGLPQQVTG